MQYIYSGEAKLMQVGILKTLYLIVFVEQLHVLCFPFYENINDSFFEAITSGNVIQ